MIWLIKYQCLFQGKSLLRPNFCCLVIENAHQSVDLECMLGCECWLSCILAIISRPSTSTVQATLHNLQNVDGIFLLRSYDN